MPVITCERCGNEFDTERDPPTEHADTTRCSACGKEHDVSGAAPAPVVEDSGADPAGAPAPMDSAETLQAVAEAMRPGGDGDVHLHLHNHRGD